MRTMIILIIPLVCGVIGCMDGEKDSAACDLDDTGDPTALAVYEQCQVFASGVCLTNLQHCAITYHGASSVNPDCAQDCYDTYLDKCQVAVKCSDRPADALRVLSAACYSFDNDADPADYCTTLQARTECGGHNVDPGEGWGWDLSVAEICPCIETLEMQHEDLWICAD